MQDRDRGSATIWLVALAMVLAVSGSVGTFVAVVAAASARAATAADLGALAGAAALLHHRGDPCAIAADVVRKNDAVLDRCAVDGVDVRVWARVVLPALDRLRLSPAQARARAGPVERPAA
jgi:secretion/DNA translocation related TadE-like protein